jgi:23S rRNA (guanosine2251-2'-O)-methyltransferase
MHNHPLATFKILTQKTATECLHNNIASLIRVCMSKRKPKNQRKNSKSNNSDAPVRLYGTHAVCAALQNPQRQVIKLWATANGAKTISDLSTAPELAHVTPDQLSPNELSRLVPPDAVHQGLVADVSPLPDTSLETIMARGGPIIVLDQIVDPRNVGAILRAAAVFGAAGIIVTRHHSPPAEGALAKTASGALEIVPLVAVANLARSLTTLADAGFMVLGLDERGTQTIDQIDTNQPLVCVMGAEGKGLRRLTRETCTELVRLPTGEAGADTHNEFVTLNVATAAAITLYALTR